MPICRALNPQEVDEDYEKNTGLVIVKHFTEEGIDPIQIPGILQLHHAPFTWGKNASKSLENSIALEMCASMALKCWATDPSIEAIPQYILDKHFLRKHGPKSYYGQEDN